MARVTLNLGLPTLSSDAFVQWDERETGYGDVSVFSSPAGESRHVVRLRIFSGGEIQFQAIDDPDGSSGFGSAEELTDTWEQFARALTVQTPTVDALADLVLPGPNSAGVDSTDTTEPYQWDPSGDAVSTWFTGYSALSPTAVTLIMDDGVEERVRSSASSGAPVATAQIRSTPNGRVRSSSSSGVPTSRAAIKLVSPQRVRSSATTGVPTSRAAIKLARTSPAGFIEVTHATNTIDAFCRAHLGGDSDALRSQFIRWNRRSLESNQTFWLPVGERFWAAPPALP